MALQYRTYCLSLFCFKSAQFGLDESGPQINRYKSEKKSTHSLPIWTNVSRKITNIWSSIIYICQIFQKDSFGTILSFIELLNFLPFSFYFEQITDSDDFYLHFDPTHCKLPTSLTSQFIRIPLVSAVSTSASQPAETEVPLQFTTITPDRFSGKDPLCNVYKFELIRIQNWGVVVFQILATNTMN